MITRLTLGLMARFADWSIRRGGWALLLYLLSSLATVALCGVAIWLILTTFVGTHTMGIIFNIVIWAGVAFSLGFATLSAIANERAAVRKKRAAIVLCLPCYRATGTAYPMSYSYRKNGFTCPHCGRYAYYETVLPDLPR